jgi:hypothetical protein
MRESLIGEQRPVIENSAKISTISRHRVRCDRGEWSISVSSTIASYFL